MFVPENGDKAFLERMKNRFDTFILFKDTPETVHMLKQHLVQAEASFLMRPIRKQFESSNQEEKSGPTFMSERLKDFERRAGDTQKQLSYLENHPNTSRTLQLLQDIDSRLGYDLLRGRLMIPLVQLAQQTGSMDERII